MNINILKAYVETCVGVGIVPTWEGLKEFKKVVVADYIQFCVDTGLQPSATNLVEQCIRLYKEGQKVV